MLLYYATRDGQSRRIAERIARRLGEAELTAVPQNLANVRAEPRALQNTSPVIVVAAVRYGYHLKEAVSFLREYAALAAAAPLVLVSVNLTARKPGKTSVQGNVYLRKLIKRHRLQPVIASAVAGRLDYPRYPWLDRQMIRLIMMITGGPTDPAAQIEFTDWQQVDDLAHRIAALAVTHPAVDDLS